jgi:hypothetical protein
MGVDVFHLKRRELNTVAAQRRDFTDGRRFTHIGSASNSGQKNSEEVRLLPSGSVKEAGTTVECKVSDNESGPFTKNHPDLPGNGRRFFYPERAR